MKKPLLISALLFSFSHLFAFEIPGASALADVILERFDENEDGVLDTGEWQAGIDEGFGQLDQDGNGNIDEVEKKNLDGLIGEEVGEGKAKLVSPIITTALRSFDENDDEAVSEEEFSKKANDLFKKLDTNSDAEVTKQELKQLPLKLL